LALEGKVFFQDIRSIPRRLTLLGQKYGLTTRYVHTL